MAILIKHKAPVLPDSEKRNLFHYLSLCKIHNIPNYVLSNFTKYLNEKDCLQKTALHYSAELKQFNQLLNLIQLGGNLDLTDNQGQTAFQILLEKGGVSIADIKSLLKAAPKLNVNQQFIGQSKILEEEYNLALAAETKKNPAFKEIDWYPGAKNEDHLHALRREKFKYKTTALNFVSQFGHVELSSPNPANFSIFQLLKNLGADPNLRDQLGFTPLVYYVKHSSIEMVKQLLDVFEGKIDFSVVDKERRNLLHHLALSCKDADGDEKESRLQIFDLLF